MAVGSPTGGLSDVVLNNILRIALWRYSRRDLIPGFSCLVCAGALTGVDLPTGVALPCLVGAAPVAGRVGCAVHAELAA